MNFWGATFEPQRITAEGLRPEHHKQNTDRFGLHLSLSPLLNR